MTGSERIATATAAETVRLVRASTAEHVLLLLPANMEPLEATLVRAALGPLAVERAPGRLNALTTGEGADPADVEAAARFLEAARSTTGQLLEVVNGK